MKPLLVIAGEASGDLHGAEILRPAPEHRLAAATRKATTLRFARAAAVRLHALTDPRVTGNVEIG